MIPLISFPALAGRPTRAAGLIYRLALSLLAGAAGAGTQTESAIFGAPMPHVSLTLDGAPVKVHRVRLQGRMGDDAMSASTLAELRQDVNACVSEHQRNGASSHPPKTWPDAVQSLRTDTYSARNRSIVYTHSVMYMMNIFDCSLREQVSALAELVSSKGVCEIDLIRKSATGVCDAGGHVDAPAPGMILLAPGIGRGTGVHKSILGVACEVWNLNPGVAGGTVCLAHGATFQPARAAGNPLEAGMQLELESRDNYNLRATEVRMDGEVSARVFVPYLSGGFEVQGRLR